MQQSRNQATRTGREEKKKEKENGREVYLKKRVAKAGRRGKMMNKAGKKNKGYTHDDSHYVHEGKQKN